MSRGRKILEKTTSYEEVDQVDLKMAAVEFFTHNQVKGLSVETQKSYKHYVNNFIVWCNKKGIRNTDEITPKILDEFILFKQEEGNKPVSIKTTMVHLRKFFNFNVSRNHMIPIEIIIPKVEQTVKEPYSEEDMKKLLEVPKTSNWVEWRNWAMVSYFYGTGQRLSTVINIKIKDLDLEKAKVKLTWNKDKIQKYMPLSSAVIKMLIQYIALSGLEEEDYLFPEYEGGQLKRRSAQDSIAKYNKERGVEKTSIHLFRNTFARDYILAGGNPAKLQKLLNHKTIDMTMHYVNLYANDISSDLDLFNPLDNFKRTNYTPQIRRKVKVIE